VTGVSLERISPSARDGRGKALAHDLDSPSFDELTQKRAGQLLWTATESFDAHIQVLRALRPATNADDRGRC